MPHLVPSATYSIREISIDEFVIDVTWPSGSTEQLLGVFTSHAHARRWLSNVPDTVAEANDRHARYTDPGIISVITSDRSDSD